MMGMSSPEWSRYMHERIGLPESPEEINDEVVERMLDALPRVAAADRRRGRRRAPARAGAFTLGVASSSNRPLIEIVLERAGIADLFAAVVSSEEVARGKPAPDVYLEAMRRLGVEPGAPPRSRTPRTGSAPRTRPGCACSRFRTRTTRRPPTRSRSPMSSSARRSS